MTNTAPTWKTDYEAAVKLFAESGGVSNLTKEEWNEHAKDKPFGALTAFARVKNVRRGVTAKKDIETMIGYCLGGRDSTSKTIELDDAKAQNISFLHVTKDTTEFLELSNWGSFTGKHGKRCEVEFERTSKLVGDREYKSLRLKKTTCTDESIDPKMLLKIARTAGELTEDDKYKTVALVGQISDNGWGFSPIWKDGEPVGDYDLITNDKISVRFNISNTPMVTINAGPFNLAEPLIGFEGFMAVARSEGLDGLARTFSGLCGVFVGAITSIKHAEQNTYCQFKATAFLPIDPDEYAAKMAQAGKLVTTGPSSRAPPIQPDFIPNAVLNDLISADDGSGIDIGQMMQVIEAKYGKQAAGTLMERLRISEHKGYAVIRDNRVYDREKFKDDLGLPLAAVKPAPVVSIPSKEDIAVVESWRNSEKIDAIVVKAHSALGDALDEQSLIAFAEKEGVTSLKDLGEAVLRDLIRAASHAATVSDMPPDMVVLYEIIKAKATSFRGAKWDDVAAAARAKGINDIEKAASWLIDNGHAFEPTLEYIKAVE